MEKYFLFFIYYVYDDSKTEIYKTAKTDTCFKKSVGDIVCLDINQNLDTANVSDITEHVTKPLLIVFSGWQLYIAYLMPDGVT